LTDIVFKLPTVNDGIDYVLPKFVTLIYSDEPFLMINVLTSVIRLVVVNVILLSEDTFKSVPLSIILLVPPTLK